MITIDGYPIDIVETEEHVLESEISSYPVEDDGGNATDNIRIKPRSLTFTNAVVSNTPIGAIASDATRKLGAGNPPPAEDAYRRLESLWQNHSTFAVVSNLKKYPSMGIETLTITREAKTAGGLVFTVKMKEVRFVSNSRTTITFKLPNTGPEKNLGLSLDNLSDGKNVLWRKGRPPGLGPGTSPPGVIYAQEVVTVTNRKGLPGLIKHANGTTLTDDERANLEKDLNRDNLVNVNRAIKPFPDNSDTMVTRSIQMLNYNKAHPSEPADPVMFGLLRPEKK